MRGALIVVVAALLLLGGCVPIPQLGDRPALPTAAVSVESTDSASLTPVPRRARTGGTSGPLSTPAPYATPMPPPPPGPPVTVAHLVKGMEDCLACHGVGGRAVTIPADHLKRTNAMCLGCHTAEDAGRVAAGAGAQRTPASRND